MQRGGIEIESVRRVPSQADEYRQGGGIKNILGDPSSLDPHQIPDQLTDHDVLGRCPYDKNAELRLLIEKNTHVVAIPRTGLHFKYAKHNVSRRNVDSTSQYTFAPAVSTQDVEGGWTEVHDVSDDWAIVDSVQNTADPRMTVSMGNIRGAAQTASSSKDSSSAVDATIALPPLGQAQILEPWYVRAGVAWRPFGYEVWSVDGQASGYEKVRAAGKQ